VSTTVKPEAPAPAVATASPAALGKERSSAGLVARRFLRHRMAVAGLTVVVLLVVAAALAPWLAPHDPNRIFDTFEASPSADHLLGTDSVGRDVLSRLIYGSRVSMSIGVGAVAVYVLIGVVLGLLAGYYGRWVDMVIMRITDVFMSFPYFMVILILVSVLGPSLVTIIVVIGLLAWPMIARLVRGSVLSIKQSDYVQAAVSLGYSTPRNLRSGAGDHPRVGSELPGPGCAATGGQLGKHAERGAVDHRAVQPAVDLDPARFDDPVRRPVDQLRRRRTPRLDGVPIPVATSGHQPCVIREGELHP